MRGTYNGIDCEVLKIKNFDGGLVALIKRQSWNGQEVHEWVNANSIKFEN